MKALTIEEYGEPEILQIREVADLKAGPGQILVRIRATGINPVEVYKRSGKPPYNNLSFPVTLGTDGAGEVAALGDGVVGLEVGQRVFVTGSSTGTYAEYALCAPGQVYPLPDHISFEQGAAIGIPYATAHRALFAKAGARSGETVFIHGATGGVGVAAIQLAMAAGLKVCGSAGSIAGEQFLESQGVKYTCNHNTPDYMSDALGMTCGLGFDILLEMLANENLAQDPDVMARFGRIVVIGNRGTTEINPRAWMARDLTIYAMTIMNATPADLEAVYTEIAAGLRRGVIKPVVGQTFALQDAPAAHDAVMRGGAKGKIVLVS